MSPPDRLASREDSVTLEGMDPQVVIRDAVAGRWLRFRNPVQVIETAQPHEVVACLRRVEAMVEQQGLHAAGFLSYEAAPAFDRALPVRDAGGFPLLWFGLYSHPDVIDLPRPRPDTGRPSDDWLPSVTQADYESVIAELRQCIARGETYQVNYTFRLRKSMQDDPWALFLDLVEAQPPEYAAYLDTAGFAVCSASPELFFRLRGDTVVSQPMKGTVSRGRSSAEDMARARWLAQSEKNRAENAMIVDMMRNDLGKVARVGSVQVRDLFQVERYPTLWQMTSKVVAKTSASVCEILGALFPCASVTGAPKPNTMRIIARVETTPRRIYTGCIGMMAPGRLAQFNVAIRTVLVDKAQGRAEYGVGGGVVWDSTPAGEYQESMLKAQILTARCPEFSLLESLLWTPQEGYFLLDQHVGRLEQSARYFGFRCPADALRQRLAQAAASLAPLPHKVRLLLSRTGDISCEAAAIDDRDGREPVRLALASGPVDSTDRFLYHKTTHRVIYDTARAGAAEGDDVLLYNERGEITETCIANVVVRLGGRLWTPSVECGLLAGTFRDWLLARGEIRESVIDLEMLDRSDEVFVINSVRKWRRALLAGSCAARSRCAGHREKAR